MTWLLIITFVFEGAVWDTTSEISPEHCRVIVEQARQGSLPTVEQDGESFPVLSVTCISPSGEMLVAEIAEVGL